MHPSWDLPSAFSSQKNKHARVQHGPMPVHTMQYAFVMPLIAQPRATSPFPSLESPFLPSLCTPSVYRLAPNLLLGMFYTPSAAREPTGRDEM